MTLLNSEFLSIWFRTTIGQIVISILLSATLNINFISLKVGNAILFLLAIVIFVGVSFNCVKKLEKIEELMLKIMAFYFIIQPLEDFLKKAIEVNFGIS